ncbi:LamB/YcsF family protein [Caballeronia mineralivorans PML1(12)]|uniref:5-oxoprolinase subunit A n=1 Tax=Caballeronia mineralivorans PML1(12) TaxID=908627 RepID=A0A0J1CXI6_9BURK|nr:5-oxoprolinase subunit PxpA [Caballeronia mineralivorans]KLU25066.1 LamB/YcsF family protein [Caballeronia mineralivorans PML1(12)]
MASIDLNCDMGESFGPWTMGNDSALLDYVTSANVACGFHAGDPQTMHHLVAAAKAGAVAVGAHPGLPDLQGFGRREMVITPQEAYSLTVYQVGALAGFTRALGIRLHHVKTHGALYQMTARNVALADAIASAVRDVDAELIVYVANPNMAQAAQRAGLRVAFEVYADRTYQDDGTLTPRHMPNAMIEDVGEAIAQVRRMLHDGVVRSLNGNDVPVVADTVCIHGDQPGALAFAQQLRAGLEADGITIRAPGSACMTDCM